MSQHILLDRPDRRIILGWDRPLQSFFGVVLDADDMAVAGWPADTGLEAGRRPIASDGQAARDLASLLGWARAQIADELAADEAAVFHLGRLLGMILRERRQRHDEPAIPVPASLQGARA